MADDNSGFMGQLLDTDFTPQNYVEKPREEFVTSQAEQPQATPQPDSAFFSTKLPTALTSKLGYNGPVSVESYLKDEQNPERGRISDDNREAVRNGYFRDLMDMSKREALSSYETTLDDAVYKIHGELNEKYPLYAKQADVPIPQQYLAIKTSHDLWRQARDDYDKFNEDYKYGDGLSEKRYAAMVQFMDEKNQAQGKAAALTRGVKDAWKGVERFVNITADITERERKLMYEEEQKIGMPLWSGTKKGQSEFAAKYRLKEYNKQHIEDEIKKRIAKEQLAGKSFVEQGLEGAAEMLPNMVAGLAANVAVPGVGGVAWWTMQSGTQIHDTILEKGGSENEAMAWGVAGGLADGLMEKFQVDKLMPGAPDAVKQEIKKRIIPTIGNFLVQGGKKFGEEVLVEAAQTAKDEIISMAATDGFSKKRMEEAWANVSDTVAQTTLSMPFLMAPGGVINARREYKDVAASMRGERSFKKMIQENPESFSVYAYNHPDVVQQLAQGNEQGEASRKSFEAFPGQWNAKERAEIQQKAREYIDKTEFDKQYNAWADRQDKQRAAALERQQGIANIEALDQRLAKQEEQQYGQMKQELPPEQMVSEQQQEQVVNAPPPVDIGQAQDVRQYATPEFVAEAKQREQNVRRQQVAEIETVSEQLKSFPDTQSNFDYESIDGWSQENRDSLDRLIENAAENKKRGIKAAPTSALFEELTGIEGGTTATERMDFVRKALVLRAARNMHSMFGETLDRAKMQKAIKLQAAEAGRVIRVVKGNAEYAAPTFVEDVNKYENTPKQYMRNLQLQKRAPAGVELRSQGMEQYAEREVIPSGQEEKGQVQVAPETAAVPSVQSVRESPVAEQAPATTAKVFYHGTNAEYKDEAIFTGNKMFGIHLTESKKAASNYGKNVKAYSLDENAKILDLSDGSDLVNWMNKNEILDKEDLNNNDLIRQIEDGQLYQYDISSGTRHADAVAKQAKSQGYDVVLMTDNLGEGSDNIATVVVNQKVLKIPKQQRSEAVSPMPEPTAPLNETSKVPPSSESQQLLVESPKPAAEETKSIATEENKAKETKYPKLNEQQQAKIEEFATKLFPLANNDAMMEEVSKLIEKQTERLAAGESIDDIVGKEPSQLAFMLRKGKIGTKRTEANRKTILQEKYVPPGGTKTVKAMRKDYEDRTGTQLLRTEETPGDLPKPSEEAPKQETKPLTAKDIPIGAHEIGRKMDKAFGLTSEIGDVPQQHSPKEDTVNKGKQGYLFETKPEPVAGLYSHFEDVYHIDGRFAGDVVVRSHEVAHNIDAKFKITENMPEEVRQELGLMDYDKKRKDASEGFAVFVSQYWANQNLALQAPLAYDYFQSWMDAHQKEAKKFKEIRADILRLQRADPEAVLWSNISRTGKLNRPSIWNAHARVSQAFADNLTYLREFDNEIRKSGRKMPKDIDPLLYARVLGGRHEAFAYAAIHDEIRSISTGRKLSDGLKKIFNMVPKEDQHALLSYHVSGHTLENARKGIQEPITVKTAQAVFDKYKNREDFQKASMAIRNWNAALLDILAEEGVITGEDARNIVQSSMFYVPMKKLIDAYSSKKVPMEQKGSARELLDPAATMAQSATFVYQAAIQAKIQRQLAAVIRGPDGLEGLGKFIRKVRPPMDIEDIAETEGILNPEILSKGNWKRGQDPVFSILNENGEREWYRMDSELYDSIASTNNPDDLVNNTLNVLNRNRYSRVLVTLAKAATKTKRALTTGISPFFAFYANIIRDMPLGMIQAQGSWFGGPLKQGAKTIENYFRIPYWMAKSKRDPNVYDMYNLFGGAEAGFIGQDIKRSYDKISDFMKHPQHLENKGKKIIRNSLDAIQAVFSIGEQAPRFEAFEDSLQRQGVNIKQMEKDFAAGKPLPMKEIFTALREADYRTTSFRQRGSALAGLNKVEAYSNATIQGYVQPARNFWKNKIQFSVRAAAILSAQTALYWWLRHDDDDYKEASPEEILGFWSIPGKDGKKFLFPKPFEVGTMFATSVELALDAAFKENPEHITKVMSRIFPTDIIESAKSIGMSLFPDLLQPAAEAMFNYDAYRRRDVVDRVDGVEPRFEYDKYSSEFAKYFGTMFNQSPKMIDHLIAGYGGSLTRDLTQPGGVTKAFGFGRAARDTQLGNSYYDFKKERDSARTQLDAMRREEKKGTPEYEKLNEKVRELNDAKDIFKQLFESQENIEYITGTTRQILGKEPLKSYPSVWGKDVPPEIKQARAEVFAKQAQDLWDKRPKYGIKGYRDKRAAWEERVSEAKQWMKDHGMTVEELREAVKIYEKQKKEDKLKKKK
jgi:hypothetical protein